MGSKNSNGRRKTLALLATTTTLAGGLTAGTAWAGGGGDQGGTGGGGSAAQFWAYKDDATGSWGFRDGPEQREPRHGLERRDPGRFGRQGRQGVERRERGMRGRLPPEASGRGRRRLPRRGRGRGVRQRVHHQRVETGPASTTRRYGRTTGTNTSHQATTIMPDLVTIRLLPYLMTIRRTASTRSWNAMSTRPAASS